MPRQAFSKQHSPLLRVAVGGVLLAAAMYVLATHWHTVETSLRVARGASIRWVALSLLLMAFTFCIAAAIYGTLALHRLRYKQTVLVEVSTAFVNRLLPSGLGGLGLHGVYLYRRKHTVAEATAVVSVNNLLGMAAHLLLLCTVLIFHPAVLHRFVHGNQYAFNWQLGLIVFTMVLLVSVVPAVRRRLQRFVRNLLASVRKIELRNLVRALVLAVTLTTAYTFVLFSSARSVGVYLGALQVFIVFSLGMLTSTATPTPGGLVGAEAGLFAGFVAYGVSTPQAGAAVLLYRLTTYWIPLAPGALALLLTRRRKLVIGK